MKVGVIGAGTMGGGIAQTFAMQPEDTVVLCDVDIETACGGKAAIAKALDRLVAKGKLEEARRDAILGKITPGVLEDVAECGLVIEAIAEREDIKRQLFAALHGLCQPEAIFASNTSSLSITALSRGLGRPLIGMHFFNPAPVMQLVEVVAGLQTPPELVERVKAICAAIGKTPVVVRDSAGFVVNRILIPMVNEAAALLAEGVASAEDIDAAMRLGANHPMGPLALGDLVGLDVCLAIMEVLHRDTGDPKYRPHPHLRKLVEAGRLGKKSGQGFYSY